MAAHRDRSKNLGRTQILVLHLLADGPKTVRTLGYDWPGLTDSAARSAVNRLGDRSLVDATGWDGAGRMYGLTECGEAVERSIVDAAGPRP